MAQVEENVKKVVEALVEALPGRVVAVYSFGSEMVSGKRAPTARLLALVDAIDGELLDRCVPVVAQATEARITLRIEVPDNITRGADVFPAFSLELIETRELLGGKDLLAHLTVEPADLRLHVEQGLRGMHRDLIAAYLEGLAREDFARTLRRSTRRLVFLLQGALMAAGVALPNPRTPDLVFRTVASSLCPEVDQRDWATLVSFASGEHVIAGDALRATYLSVLHVLEPLIAMVDTMNTAESNCGPS